MLEVRSLSKRYDDVVALDDVSLSVGRGELLGFLGPNGAGKTTAMRAVLGVVSIDGGEVRWDGSPMTAGMRAGIGYMPSERGMYPKMHVREHVVYFARLTGLNRTDAERATDRWLERLGLSHRAGTEVQALSSGNQQRVQLALALVNDPELLVLDEPFAGLDPLATEVLKDVLLERVEAGAALLFSSHQLDLVEQVSRNVVIIDRGRVVLAGDVGELRRSSPHRYVDLTFATDVSWTPAIGTVIVKEPQHLVVQVEPDVDLSRMLADAQVAAPLASFSFEPPELSEVFLAAVGRTAVEIEPEQEDAP